jgi:polar amino acid transport system substrate-binding protein
MRNVARLLGLAAVAAGLVVAVAGTAFAETTLEKIKRTGKLLAGVRYDYAPIGSVDADGKNVGFGVDIARAFAQKLGVEPVFVQTTSRTRIPLLQNGSIDADIGPTTPTKERNEVVDFSIVYYWDDGVLLVRKGDSRNPKDYAPPKKVSTTQGSYFVEYFKEVVANPAFQLFQEYPEAVIALTQRKVDAVVINKYAAIQFAQRFPNTEVSETFVRDPIAIGVRQNDSKWLNLVNWTLQEMWLDGRYQQIFAKHFGYKPDFMLWSPYRLQPGIGK